MLNAAGKALRYALQKRLVVGCGGRVYAADFSDAHGPHAFGGAPTTAVRGLPPRAKLHFTGTLRKAVPELPSIPLFYGFRHSGCRLEYGIVDESTIEILKLDPETPDEGWPYPSYPREFPRRRFSLEEVACADIGASPAELLGQIATQGLDGFDFAKESVVILPPDPESLGTSFWGDEGDAMGVQVVFRIDALAGIVRVENQCG